MSFPYKDFATVRALHIQGRYYTCVSLVPRPHHACEERVWGHWHRILVLQAQQSRDYLCRFILGSCDHLHGAVLDHVMVHKTKKMLQCPQTLFPRGGWGLGTRLYLYRHAH